MLSEVTRGLLVRVKFVEAAVGANGDVAVEDVLITLLSAHQLEVVGELLNSIPPLGVLRLLILALVLKESSSSAAPEATRPHATVLEQYREKEKDQKPKTCFSLVYTKNLPR